MTEHDDSDEVETCDVCGDTVTYFWRFADGFRVCLACPTGNHPVPAVVVDRSRQVAE